MKSENTGESLAAAKAGDRAAFADLVREHQSMVFSLGLHFLRNRAAAEELSQDVFLSLFENLQSIESPAHLSFWLRRVASNRCIDYGRREKNRPGVGLDDVREPSAPAVVKDPLLSGAIDRLTATLGERSRLILTLRYQEDLEPTEIAQVLDMPVNTVKSQLHRSLAFLREKFERVGVRS